MMRLLILLFFSLLLLQTAAFGQWSTDPANNLIVGYGLNPDLCSDSAGGAYVLFDESSSTPNRQYLVRINRYGYKPWGGTKRLTGLLPEQGYGDLAEDGQGGVLVTYGDYQTTGIPEGVTIPWYLRAQRIDSNGNFLWGANGVRVSLDSTLQGDEVMVTDGHHGCIIIWDDWGHGKIMRAQRVDSNGTRRWGENGIALGQSYGKACVIADIAGGMIVSYYGGNLQRINSYGQTVWPDTGIKIPTGAMKMEIDHNGFIYLLGAKDIKFVDNAALFTYNVQKIDTSGRLYWGHDGFLIDTLHTNNIFNVTMAYNGAHIAMSWSQYRQDHWEIMTQILREDGTALIPGKGVWLGDTVLSSKEIFEIVPSGNDSYIYVWNDRRNPQGTYLEKIDTAARIRWDTKGVALSLPELSWARSISDGHAGIIAVGESANFSIRAQQCDKNGKIGMISDGVSYPRTAYPLKIFLEQNYPNPFNPLTTIPFTLQQTGHVRLEIFNVIGCTIRTLVDEFKPAGEYKIQISSNNLPSGIYYYRITTREGSITRKLTIIK